MARLRTGRKIREILNRDIGSRQRTRQRTPLLLGEIITINPPHPIHVDIGCSHLVFNHQARELLAVDQHNAIFDMADVVHRVRGVARGCDEDALASPQPCSAPTNFWISGRLTGFSQRLACT